MDRYTILAKIGSGSFSTVYKARDTQTDTIVAVKRVYFEGDGIPSGVVREISILQELQHENIVRLRDVVLERHETNDRVNMILDYVDQDLVTMIRNANKPFERTFITSCMRQLLQGLAFCHERSFMHRDIKPHNLLVDSSGHLKIADFGISRSFGLSQRSNTIEVVTLWYRAPEVLLADPYYTTKIDVWSAGCILGELITRHPLIMGDSEIDQLIRIFRLMGTPTEETWPGFTSLRGYSKQLPVYLENKLIWTVTLNGDKDTTHLLEPLVKMLICDPSKRITAIEAAKLF